MERETRESAKEHTLLYDNNATHYYDTFGAYLLAKCALLCTWEHSCSVDTLWYPWAFRVNFGTLGAKHMDMLLYRGDNFYNATTEPGRFWFDGIRAKSFGKGDPAYIKRKGVLKAMRQHIYHPTKADEDYYNTTDFISFSTDKARAMCWVSDKSTLVLVPCTQPYLETRYVFTMDIPDGELVHIGGGLYSFSFTCNLTLKKANTAMWLQGELPHYDQCHLCGGRRGHQILLVNTVECLMLYRDEEKVEDALALAIEDAEWLVLPHDPLLPFGRSSTIQRADFWSVDRFTVVGEKRDPMKSKG